MRWVRAFCSGHFSNLDRGDCPSPKKFISQNKIILSHNCNVKRAVTTCWVSCVCWRVVCVRSRSKCRMRLHWCCLPAPLQWMVEFTHPFHQCLEGVYVLGLKTKWLLEPRMAARGQGIPLESRKLAPVLQFVVFKSDSWSNHLLFVKRTFYHMVKLFF